MKILTVENVSYDLDTVPDEIDEIHYCVLVAEDSNEVDVDFLPLVFLESFHAPAICLQIGDYRVQMPLDWSIMICDSDYSAVEVIPLASLNNRGFLAVTQNPMSSRTLENLPVQITNIYADVKWYFPKLKNGHMLAIPLEDGDKPRCAYFVKDINKVCDLDLADIM